MTSISNSVSLQTKSGSVPPAAKESRFSLKRIINRKNKIKHVFSSTLNLQASQPTLKEKKIEEITAVEDFKDGDFAIFPEDDFVNGVRPISSQT
jgi:hypothetical protein